MKSCLSILGTYLRKSVVNRHKLINTVQECGFAGTQNRCSHTGTQGFGLRKGGGFLSFCARWQCENQTRGRSVKATQNANKNKKSSEYRQLVKMLRIQKKVPDYFCLQNLKLKPTGAVK